VGATATSFTIPTTLAVGTYYYYCVVSGTNWAVDVASNVAMVTVKVSEIPTYAVTVINGAGDGDYREGKTVTVIADTAPTGQRFKEWTTESADVIFDDKNSSTTTFEMPAHAVTVTANYEAIPPTTYTVIVVSGAGSGSYAAGDTVSISADAAPSGQQFKEWNITPSVIFTSGSATTPAAAFTMPAEAVTAMAVYRINTYTVTFVDHDSTQLRQETVEHGSAATAPAAPTRTGYTFTGWDKTFDSVTEDMTVMALYEINTYTVTVTNGSGGGEYEAGATVTITANAAPTGQQFKQWSITLAVVFTSGSAHTPTAAFTMLAQDVAVAAVYETIPVVIPPYSVAVTNGSGGGEYEAGATVTVTADTAPTGQQFKQWNITPVVVFTSGSANTPTAAFTMLAQDVAVSAIYEYACIPADVAYYDRFVDVLTVPIWVEGIGDVHSIEWYLNGVLLDHRDPAKGYIETKEAGTYHALINGTYRTCGVTRQKSANTLNMSVYPNPAIAGGKVTVSINRNADELQGAYLQMFNMSGRLLKSVSVNGSETSLEVPANAGITVIKLFTKQGNKEVKLIID
jgi:uncharacterized repeat protein (TIGR02543 family)